LAAADLGLRVDALSVRYGRIVALQDATIEVGRGEVVSLLGANGSGKTTLLNTVSGFVSPAAGTIRFGTRRIDSLPPHRVFRLGVIHVSQGRDLFTDLSVLDNLELGAAVRGEPARLAADLERVFGYFPRLAERKAQRVITLSGGEQQMLAIARGLMGQPEILLLDEPSAGLAPLFVAEIRRIIGALKSAGTTMLVVEQNIPLALGVADRYYILRAGRIVKQGHVAELGETHEALARTYYL
jgi:branched-chain amino acid transport system ATP-binding protein